MVIMINMMEIIVMVRIVGTCIMKIMIGIIDMLK